MRIVYCSVDSCTTWRGSGFPFFRCPKDEARCQIWRTQLGFTENHRYSKILPEQCYERIRVCSQHFTDDSFMTSSKQRLNYNAIPTLFLKKPTSSVNNSGTIVSEVLSSELKDASVQTDTLIQTNTNVHTNVNVKKETMASVEPCEAPASGLATLSSTLEIFNTFKPQEEDEKDSDEESFHLPMLGCDDDLDSNKETLTNGTSKNPGESEDEILNKFETSGTPDIDPKTEESILEDIDKLCDDKENVEKDTVSNKDGVEEESTTATMEKESVSVASEVVDESLGSNKENEDNKKDAENKNNMLIDEQDINSDELENCVNINQLLSESEELREDDTSQGSNECLKIANHEDHISKDNNESLETEKLELLTKNNENLENVSHVEEETNFNQSVDIKEESLNISNSSLIEGTEISSKTDENNLIEEESEVINKSGEEIASIPEICEKTTDITEGCIKTKELTLTKADEEIEKNHEENGNTDEKGNMETDGKANIEIDEKEDIENDKKEDMEIDEKENMETDEKENMETDDKENIESEEKEHMETEDKENMETDAKENVEIDENEKVEKDKVSESVGEKEQDKIIEIEPIISKEKDTAEGVTNTEIVECESEKEFASGTTQACDTQEGMEIDTDDIETSHNNKSETLQIKFIEDDKLKDSSDEINTMNKLEDKLLEDDKLEDECSIQDEQVDEEKLLSDILDKKDETKLLETNSLNEIFQNNKTSASIENEEISASNRLEEKESEKCENSNDSSKSNNLECEDLLDISIIRDADEDNASAIAENANDARCSERSDNDDQDEGSDKADNELDESEMDQEDTLTNDKDDAMDFEYGNSNSLCENDNTISGNTSDSEFKDDDTKDSEKQHTGLSVLKEKTNEIDFNETDSEKTQTEDAQYDKLDNSSKVAISENRDTANENFVKLGKRSLSDGDNDKRVVKKIRLSDETNAEEKRKTGVKDKKVKTLLTFEKFMRNRKLEEKLTRSDLEQFCLQKICEAIMHKTDVGELHQTIKKQEQIIDNLRKDLQQLTKQTRDLDIVNKKLMNELKSQNGSKKPLVPLKITRSVGLQVKLNCTVDNNIRRKTPATTPLKTPNANASVSSGTNSGSNNNVRPRTINPSNTSVVRQVVNSSPSPRKTPTQTQSQTQNSTTPLLSQALQSRQPAATNTPKRTPIRPKPTEPQKSGNPGVIDLTDEDDKASKGLPTTMKIIKTVPLTQAKSINSKSIIPSKTVTTKTINTNQNKTVAVGQVKTATVGNKVGTPTRTVTALPQGVRLTPTQVKNGSIAIPASVVTSSSGTTQLMYVVQSTSSLGQVVTSTAAGGQKAVLLNFQPTNGVLTSTLNGSAVSVIPTKTATNTLQLKPITTVRKHPAPLPTPPPITVNASLKPLLPKPHLSIRKTDTGIILQWRMPYNLDIYEGIASYQLFAYQETNAPPSTEMWRKVGDVKALALPMACTLTQFADKNKYYFAVRSVDVHKRIGAFSDPEEISL